VATTGVAKAKQVHLPESATITIENKKPNPKGEVEVTPNGGRITFENEDNKDYRLRLFKWATRPEAGIDILLPANGSVTVVIKSKDEFGYGLVDIGGGKVEIGGGGGPIKN
jgi:hypothetical protein